METAFPLIFALAMGFSHAFEADHLVAVSTIVTRRTSFFAAAKDGLFWGLGHTSTIFIIGAVMIVGKVVISEQAFHYLEASVGAMLVALGGMRLWKLWSRRGSSTVAQGNSHEYPHEHQHEHIHSSEHPHSHSLAYGVGAVHGLAGSGALVLLVMSNIAGAAASMLYLFNFGMGSVGGMLVAAGVFSLPFSKKFSTKLHTNTSLQEALTVLSAAACVGYGVWIIIENLAQ